MKNIVFDLGGVVFARDPQKCEKEFIDFFAFIIMENMPEFWVDYDRGKVSYDDVVEALSKYHGCTREVAEGHMRTAIGMQEEIRWTKELVADLKRAGYRLYVLSNMSKEFIEFLRRFAERDADGGERDRIHERYEQHADHRARKHHAAHGFARLVENTAFSVSVPLHGGQVLFFHTQYYI